MAKTTIPSTMTLDHVRALHPLAPAVLERLGIDTVDGLGTLLDAAEYGGDGGFRGFTYHGECRAFVVENRVAIARLLAEAEEYGLDMVASLQADGIGRGDIYLALAGADLEDSDGPGMAYSYLAWLALESVGAALADHIESAAA